MTLLTVACPLCKQSESFLDVKVPGTDLHIHKYGAIYAGKSTSEWKICGCCGFVHQNPRPSAESLNEFYMQSKYHQEAEDISVEEYLKFARWYFSEKIDFSIAKSGLQNGAVFDIGCGRGGVLDLYEKRGWRSYGVEPDQGLSAFANQSLGLGGVGQGILDSNYELPEKVDMVFSNHAFEHFSELEEVMQGVLNILKPDGYMFIVVPTYYRNRSSLSKRWMNSAHYSMFTHNSLNNLLSRYGFEEIAHTYNGWKKEIDDLWYMAKLTNKEIESERFYENPKQVSFYLRFTNPLRSFLFYPIYSHWAARVRVYSYVMSAVDTFVNSPSTFFRKALRRIRQFMGH